MAQKNLIGKTILGYTVEEQLGIGAFGTVYKVVKSNPSGQYVRALKHITIPTERQYISVLNSMGGDVSKADDYFSEMLKNIVSEIQILNNLSEKGIQNIVRYYENDIVTTDSPKRYDVYILMEYLTPLEDYIAGNVFTVNDVVKIGLDILDGLHSCHANGVIHRDIKDENIFVSPTGDYKIGDFGVSKILKDSSKAESLKGTPNFLAPEVYLGKESYTQSVDLYSLGIVLYRLLNYSRNPFLPHFPAQYSPQDESAAFEARMNGKVPDLPSLGGEYVGKVIVKAISSSVERFQSADEFRDALQSAIDNTSDEILSKKILFTSSPALSKSQSIPPKDAGATIADVLPSLHMGENSEVERDWSVNSHLFDSIGESPNSQMSNEPIEGNGSLPPANECRVAPPIPPMEDMDSPMPVDRNIIGKLSLAMPIIILFLGIVAYFVIIPNVYGKVVAFSDWLFSGSQNIKDTLHDPNEVLPAVHSTIGLGVFWTIWFAGFVASLFFAGRHLHAKPEPDAPNALMTKKEPFLMIQEVCDTLKQMQATNGGKKLNGIIASIKHLEEKLSYESDFGYGKGSVIRCENNIAAQIQFLMKAVPDINKGNVEQNIDAASEAVKNINTLLHRRTELKKHRS